MTGDMTDRRQRAALAELLRAHNYEMPAQLVERGETGYATFDPAVLSDEEIVAEVRDLHRSGIVPVMLGPWAVELR